MNLITTSESYYVFKPDDLFNNENLKANNKIPSKAISENKKIRILIVEDEDITRNTLSSILKEMGYEVITAEDGYEAIENIENSLINIAIVDIKLPGIDGLETFKLLKEKFPEIKGIIITAYSAESWSQRVLETGASICLSKPFNVDEIISIIMDMSNDKKN